MPHIVSSHKARFVQSTLSFSANGTVATYAALCTSPTPHSTASLRGYPRRDCMSRRIVLLRSTLVPDTNWEHLRAVAWLTLFKPLGRSNVAAFEEGVINGRIGRPLRIVLIMILSDCILFNAFS